MHSRPATGWYHIQHVQRGKSPEGSSPGCLRTPNPVHPLPHPMRMRGPRQGSGGIRSVVALAEVFAPRQLNGILQRKRGMHNVYCMDGCSNLYAVCSMTFRCRLQGTRFGLRWMTPTVEVNLCGALNAPISSTPPLCSDRS